MIEMTLEMAEKAVKAAQAKAKELGDADCARHRGQQGRPPRAVRAR